MLIDWFTVVAQIVNFLVLVALLKHFLYGRIIRAMEVREEKIASRLQDAEDERREALREAEDYRRKAKELEERREELLLMVKEEVEGERKRLLHEARAEVNEFQRKWHENIRQEKDAFLLDLKRRVSVEVCLMARHVLSNLANKQLEKQIMEVFLERLLSHNEEELRVLRESFGQSGGRVLMRSSFEIPEESRARMMEALRDRIGEELDFEFEVSADLICGIELRANAHKIGWNMENYLKTLEEDILRVIEEGAG
ncbi:F0F1 ATP synthase subunit B family protein [Desulforhabdus amnigena]|uniref:ATP synthase subunit b n=1 Tax=Desulforhabdus amnigena TaxID=40218 RepID=A0A9W6FS62_9BACT|nr:hypothetical protein [Desulforhabdus amnigena]NLJ29052.1 F0F1 ATP synthase subunit B [Deltaproteobacteria bacterium]GLI33709.1 ATP synthase subunit B [Desulforhabdus amnigena]